LPSARKAKARRLASLRAPKAGTPAPLRVEIGGVSLSSLADVIQPPRTGRSPGRLDVSGRTRPEWGGLR
jgi:hypothetical protein